MSPNRFEASFIPNSKYNQLRSLSFLVLSLLYGWILSQLPNGQFHDFNNYIVYAESSWIILLRNINNTFLSIIINEPIWLLLNIVLGLILEPELIVRTFIFFGASSFSWLILKHNPKNFFWLVLFLFLPQVIKNYLIHLRQGVAISVFLWGWFAANRSTRWLLIAITPLIHASFFFILFLLILSNLFSYLRLAWDLKSINFVIVGLAFGVGLGVLAEFLGTRYHYSFERTSVSGLGFVLWFIVLGIMLTSSKKWLREYAFESGIIIFYLGTYWFFEVTGRIFESGLILALLAGLELRSWRKSIFLIIMLGSGLMIWIQRLNHPGLGFLTS